MVSLTEGALRHLRLQAPGESVALALTDFLTHDGHLLHIDANERSITFRFGMYLQARMPEWNIDCEFNRDGINPKKLAHMDLYPDSEDDEAKTVFPDVIAHERGTNRNHLVIEFKKSTSSVDRKIDLRKLVGYKQQLGFAHALFIEIGTDGQCSVHDICWI